MASWLPPPDPEYDKMRTLRHAMVNTGSIRFPTRMQNADYKRAVANVNKAKEERLNAELMFDGHVRTSLVHRSEIWVHHSLVPQVSVLLSSPVMQQQLSLLKIAHIYGWSAPSIRVHFIIIGSEPDGREKVVEIIDKVCRDINSELKVMRFNESYPYKCDICFNWYESFNDYDEWHFREQCYCCSYCFNPFHLMFECPKAQELKIKSYRQIPKDDDGNLKICEDKSNRKVAIMSCWRHPSFNGGPKPYYFIDDLDNSFNDVRRFVVSMSRAHCFGFDGIRVTEVILHVKTEFDGICMIYHQYINDEINLFCNYSDKSETSIVQMRRGKEKMVVRHEVLQILKDRLVVFNNYYETLGLLGIDGQQLLWNNIDIRDLGFVFDNTPFVNNNRTVTTVTNEELTLFCQGKVIGEVLQDNFARPRIITKYGDYRFPKRFNLGEDSRNILENFIIIDKKESSLQRLSNLSAEHVKAWADMELVKRHHLEKCGTPFKAGLNDEGINVIHALPPTRARIEQNATKHIFCKTPNVLKLRRKIGQVCPDCRY